MELPEGLFKSKGRGKYDHNIKVHLEHDAAGDPHLVIVHGIVQGNGINRNGRKYDLGEETVDAENN